MKCPLCDAAMEIKQNNSTISHKSLKCCKCNFVIFFKGIPELDA
jgi:predicted Zn finger-like uncharacterized protein